MSYAGLMSGSTLNTQKSYPHAVAKLSTYSCRSPDRRGPEKTCRKTKTRNRRLCVGRGMPSSKVEHSVSLANLAGRSNARAA
eukprot:12320976-Heterocapsa_arctica.AAC.1